MLRVRSKGNKNASCLTAAAQEALEVYCPVREQLLVQSSPGSRRRGPAWPSRLSNYAGRRLPSLRRTHP
jgi:hypothetical protein